jgi:hypothetical protein
VVEVADNLQVQQVLADQEVAAQDQQPLARLPVLQTLVAAAGDVALIAQIPQAHQAAPVSSS